MGDLGRRSVRGGAWLAVLGPDLTVVVPGEHRSRAARVWEKVDAGARVEEVLDALVAPGIAESGDFALVRTDGSRAQVIVRGGPAVSVITETGPLEVVAGDLIWSEELLSDVESMVLSLPGEDPGADDRPAFPGLVRAGAVRWGDAGRVDDAVPATPQPVPEPEPVPVSGPEPVPVSGPEPVPVPEPAPVPEPQRPQQPPQPSSEAATEVFPAPSFGMASPGSPQPPQPPLPPQPPSPGAATGPVLTPDHDGPTQAGAPPAPPTPPGIPGQPPTPAVLARPVARLVFSHGETIEVDRAVLVGRAPEVRRQQGGEEPRLVTVPSPGLEISSTHLEIRPGSGIDHGTATATDLGSTNGTLVMQPGLPPEELRPGMAIALVPGAVLDLGDGMTIQVIRP